MFRRTTLYDRKVSQTLGVRLSVCVKERTLHVQGKENGPTRVHIFRGQQGTSDEGFVLFFISCNYLKQASANDNSHSKLRT